MENVSQTESSSLKDLPPATDNIHLPNDDLNAAENNLNLNDCFIDVTPGSSKYCKLFPNNEELNKDLKNFATKESPSTQSVESIVCRICQNSENPERLVSPCMCKGTLTYVHINCLERWISLSHCTTCELCQFQYNTQQTLRYSLMQSLRIWYSRSMSRRALQEDCQMFSLLTLIAFGIVGTLLVAVQYYILQGHVNGLGRLWTKGWLIFFLLTTLLVYIINVYMIVKSQLMPWYRWWQSARDIRLILENHQPSQFEVLKQMSFKKQNMAPEEATNDATKMLCHQQNQISLGKTKEVNNQTNNKTYPNSIETSTATSLFLNAAASYSNNSNNKPQLLWKTDNVDDVNDDDDDVACRTKKILAMMPQDDTFTDNTTCTTTTIAQGNKSAVTTIAANMVMPPLASSPFIFDCIAVV